MTTAQTTSVLGCALLGLLARESLTGYAMASRMSRPIGYFWTAGHSQIYPELSRLEAAGLVHYQVVEGAGPRETKRYSITDTGRQALLDWLVAAPEPMAQRDTEILRIWSLWTLDPEQARAVVDTIRTRHEQARADLAHQHGQIADLPAATDPADPQFASLLTIEGGLRSHEASIAWCAWMLERLPVAAGT